MSRSRRRSGATPRISGLLEWLRSGGVALSILLALMAVIALGGGASRADTLGQGFVRGAALLAIAGWILAGARFDLRRVRAPLTILVAAMLLVVVQLVPLPFSLWSALPGRELFVDITRKVGFGTPWRPLALVPDGALNALLSLLVPLAVLLGVSALSDRHARRLLFPLLAVTALSALVGSFQLSTGSVSNPLINSSLGQPSGLFANRNHQALFLSLGVLLALGWGFDPLRRIGARSWTALGIVAILALLVLATGSRAGLGLLALALLSGALIARPAMVSGDAARPRWIVPMTGVAVIAVAAGLAFLSFDNGRAVAIDRLFAIDPVTDMRARAVPTLRLLIELFFPFGSGMGSFDAVFRMAEPMHLLKPTYFNHAHNEFAELLLEAGFPGLMLIGGALLWWAWSSWRAWRAGPIDGHQGRLGSWSILLVLVASMVDYPARTPLIMGVLAMAACWLSAVPDRARL